MEYTHHSTAVEGNTLTLIETKVVLVAELEEKQLDKYLANEMQ